MIYRLFTSAGDELKDEKKKKFFSQMLHNTTIDYTLVDNEKKILSLDVPSHTATIRDIGISHVIHCAATDAEILRVGDLIVASEFGSSVHSQESVAGRRLSTFMQSPQVTRNEGFLVIRRITASSTADADTNTKCLRHETVDQHPLETLIAGFDVRVDAKSPFSVTQFSKEAETEEAEGDHRDLQAQFPTGAGFPLCEDFKDVKQGSTDREPYTSYLLGASTSATCVKLQSTINAASFATNYNAATRSAVTKGYVIGDSGLVCKNCYLYIGGNVQMYLSFQNGKLGFESHVTGPVGSRADIGFNGDTYYQPTSKAYGLSAGSSDFVKFDLFGGAGLSIILKMGGMRAEVSGSGNARGNGFFRSGGDTSAAAVGFRLGVDGVPSIPNWGFNRFAQPVSTYSSNDGDISLGGSSNTLRVNISFPMELGLTGTSISALHPVRYPSVSR